MALMMRETPLLNKNNSKAIMIDVVKSIEETDSEKLINYDQIIG